jgi:acetoin utilization protein AcuB
MDHAEMPIVSDYMTPGPYLTSVEESLDRVLAFMGEHGVRHLPVLDGGQLVGVVSDRDVGLVQTVLDSEPAELSVGDAMTPDPYVVAPNDPLNHVARAMVERRIGSAVVVDRGKVIGMFTASDGLQALIEALEGTYARRTYEAVTTEPPEARRPSDLR